MTLDNCLDDCITVYVRKTFRQIVLASKSFSHTNLWLSLPYKTELILREELIRRSTPAGRQGFPITVELSPSRAKNSRRCIWLHVWLHQYHSTSVISPGTRQGRVTESPSQAVKLSSHPVLQESSRTVTVCFH